MQPNLFNNDRITVMKCSELERFKVVIVRPPNTCQMPARTLMVKRIIALGGETVEIREGETYINNILQTEEFEFIPTTYNFGPRIVPDGKVFVRGDNREMSHDCHDWVTLWGDEGFIPMENIVGEVGEFS